MNQETGKKLKVEITGDSEYSNFLGKTGEMIGTIPPNSNKPHRIMVKLNNGPIVNFKAEEVNIIKEDKKEF